ncbi:hypothetical protein [Bacillus cereus group sp. BfR-BA-01380]|uniref:hypothetical protein n=1 Tax=Bacillus cereus group sp. BfR-BA-01380 TaxID=2920324 RepID=UPI001F59A5EB|nr:hypothetical protein [Bacillus cereus group sp. BfR-BA-01380]
MSKRIFTLLLAFTLFSLPTFAQAKGFSGGKSSVSSHTSSGGFSTKGSTSGSYRSSDGTYHSGYKSSSSNVQSKKQAAVDHHTSQPQPAPKKSSFWGHAASFGAGALLGSMLHPFGNHGVGGVGGSFFSSGLLIDIVIILGIIWALRRIFARR